MRRPLRVRERPNRTLDQRLVLRFPRLAGVLARLAVGRRSPTSRVRQQSLARGTRSAMEAFNRRDLDAAVTPGHPDFEMRPPHELVEAGFFEPCYRGMAGFREYVSAWAEVFGFRVEPVELIDVGDRIVLLVEIPLRARASGVPITQEYAFVATLENGKVAHQQEYLHHAEALEAVGLAE